MQGYLTIACGQRRYLDMASNLAKSIRYFDPKRPICLVHDEAITLSEPDKAVFDRTVLLPSHADYVGCMNKIRIYDVTPFTETMYVDADCLMAKRDVEYYWNGFSNAGCFSLAGGEKSTSGRWNRMDIAKVCSTLSIPYVVRMNSGLFYFRKSPETAEFFAKVEQLYRGHRDLLSHIHQGRAGQYADEPLLGAAMGIFSLEPIHGPPTRSLMVSTWRARHCALNPETEESYLEKPVSCPLGIPMLASKWVPHRPIFFHFIGLTPACVYEKAARFFENAFLSGAARQGVI